jgi:thiosulfate/3-mercaptopyruvate sulfurtransferase
MSATSIKSELLVNTDWVDEHRHDEDLRIVESDEDLLLYQQGHVRKAVKIDWQTDLQDQTVRDYLSKDRFSELCASRGISNDTTVVFYGDKDNWWACYALWAFKLYGHDKCLIMDGGRRRWELDGREFVREPEPDYPRGTYAAKDPDLSIRDFRDEVLQHQAARKSMCARAANTRASCCTWKTIHKKARCARATFPAQPAFRGPVRSTTTGRLSRMRNWSRFTLAKLA